MPASLSTALRLFGQTTRLLLAPLLAIIVLTVGCGRSPNPLGSTIRRESSTRQIQAVSEFNVGVGLNTATNEYFMFSDLEAAKLAPEASTSFLVAFDGYELVGPHEGTSGRIDAQVVVPGAGQYPVSAAIDVFYRQYDWYQELAGANRDITPEMFGLATARASSASISYSMSPREAVSAVTWEGAAGAYTVGSAWGDIRLMLAAIGVWAKLQPPMSWGGSGGGTGSPLVDSISPAATFADVLDLTTNAVTPITQTPVLSQSSNSIVVALETVEFASGSATPNKVHLRTMFPDGRAEGSTVSIDTFAAVDWRSFLGDPAATLSTAVLGQMSFAVNSELYYQPSASIQALVSAAMAGMSTNASLELSAVLVAATVKTRYLQYGSPVPAELSQSASPSLGFGPDRVESEELLVVPSTRFGWRQQSLGSQITFFNWTSPEDVAGRTAIVLDGLIYPGSASSDIPIAVRWQVFTPSGMNFVRQDIPTFARSAEWSTLLSSPNLSSMDEEMNRFSDNILTRWETSIAASGSYQTQTSNAWPSPLREMDCTLGELFGLMGGGAMGGLWLAAGLEYVAMFWFAHPAVGVLTTFAILGAGVLVGAATGAALYTMRCMEEPQFIKFSYVPLYAGLEPRYTGQIPVTYLPGDSLSVVSSDWGYPFLASTIVQWGSDGQAKGTPMFDGNSMVRVFDYSVVTAQ